MPKNQRPKYSVSICLPVYKGSHVLPAALKSILKQKFTNYEVLIGDDNFPDNKSEIRRTQHLVQKINDKRIKYYKNQKNLGYPLNLKNIVARAKNDIIFLMAQDDILSRDALQTTHDAFLLDKNVGVVTRPYYWYMDDINKPVRVVKPYDDNKDVVLSVIDGEKEFIKIFESVGQLTGLAYMKKYLTTPFNLEVFPAHIYPFAGILKKHNCVFIHNYTVAVGIKDSQTRSKSSIYDLSPTDSWMRMYISVFSGEKLRQQRQWGIKHMSTHFEGLVQIKNYAAFDTLIKEIIVLLTYRWKNVFSLKFWFYVMTTLLLPRQVLIKLTDWYKSNILSQNIPIIEFKHY